MPELPEVQTIVNDLNKKIKGFVIQDVWSDWPKMIKTHSLRSLKNELRGLKVLKIRRRAKNIFIDLTNNKTLLIHLKMTGHPLIRDKNWQKNPGALAQPVNQFIHFILKFKNGKELALSDLRKFAKIMLVNTNEVEELEEIKNLGPEPLERDFTFNKFLQVLKDKKGAIKKILQDQTVIAGIGNIYADEILWEAKVHPLSRAEKLSLQDFKNIFQGIKQILSQAIKLRGTSTSDYRDTAGETGDYQRIRKVYRRQNESCSRCRAKIKRITVGQRGTHFCPQCQRVK